MNKSIIRDCIAHFKILGLHAYEHEYDGGVYLKVSEDLSVQLSEAEVLFQADELARHNRKIASMRARQFDNEKV